MYAKAKIMSMNFPSNKEIGLVLRSNQCIYACTFDSIQFNENRSTLEDVLKNGLFKRNLCVKVKISDPGKINLFSPPISPDDYITVIDWTNTSNVDEEKTMDIKVKDYKDCECIGHEESIETGEIIFKLTNKDMVKLANLL